MAVYKLFLRIRFFQVGFHLSQLGVLLVVVTLSCHSQIFSHMLNFSVACSCCKGFTPLRLSPPAQLSKLQVVTLASESVVAQIQRNPFIFINLCPFKIFQTYCLIFRLIFFNRTLRGRYHKIQESFLTTNMSTMQKIH